MTKKPVNLSIADRCVTCVFALQSIGLVTSLYINCYLVAVYTCICVCIRIVDNEECAR